MHAVRATSQRDIGAIVDQKFLFHADWQIQDAPHETRQFPPAEIFFTDLNALDACRELPRDIRHQCFHAAQRLAIGDVVTEHYSGV